MLLLSLATAYAVNMQAEFDKPSFSLNSQEEDSTIIKLAKLDAMRTRFLKSWPHGNHDLIFSTTKKEICIEDKLACEKVCLSKELMAELFVMAYKQNQAKILEFVQDIAQTAKNKTNLPEGSFAVNIDPKKPQLNIEIESSTAEAKLNIENSESKFSSEASIRLQNSKPASFNLNFETGSKFEAKASIPSDHGQFTLNASGAPKQNDPVAAYETNIAVQDPNKTEAALNIQLTKSGFFVEAFGKLRNLQAADMEKAIQEEYKKWREEFYNQK